MLNNRIYEIDPSERIKFYIAHKTNVFVLFLVDSLQLDVFQIDESDRSTPVGCVSR